MEESSRESRIDNAVRITFDRPTYRSRRAKATLAWGFALVVLGQLFVTWLVDHPFRKYRFGSDVEDYLDRGSSSMRGNGFVVLLGSSRIGCGLRADELSPIW